MRIAESLAKMKLQAVAGEEEVDEALRLFQVSTLDAALSGSLSGQWVGRVCGAVLLAGPSLFVFITVKFQTCEMVFLSLDMMGWFFVFLTATSVETLLHCHLVAGRRHYAAKRF